MTTPIVPNPPLWLTYTNEPGVTLDQTQSSTLINSTGSALVSKKVLESIGVMIVVAVILTQVAGINKDWAVVVGLLLLGAIMMRAMAMTPTQSAAANSLPFIP